MRLASPPKRAMRASPPRGARALGRPGGAVGSPPKRAKRASPGNVPYAHDVRRSA